MVKKNTNNEFTKIESKQCISIDQGKPKQSQTVGKSQIFPSGGGEPSPGPKRGILLSLYSFTKQVSAQEV